MSESDTPRVDAEEEHASNVDLYISMGETVKWKYGPMVVPSDFARELERENNRLKRQLEEAEGLIRRFQSESLDRE